MSKTLYLSPLTLDGSAQFVFQRHEELCNPKATVVAAMEKLQHRSVVA